MAERAGQNTTFTELLDRARAGSPEALDTALREILPSLDRRASDLLGGWLAGRVGASDVLQEALVEVVRSIGNFGGTTRPEFATWVHRIVDRAALRVHRYLTAKKRRPPSSPSGLEALAATLRPNVATPSGEARASEFEDLCRKAIAELTIDQRLVVERVLLAGDDIDDVASDFGRTPDATRALLARARARLALRLERLGVFDSPSN